MTTLGGGAGIPGVTIALVAPGHPLLGVLAHQGGWDEILLVAAPLLLIVALLRLAKRRVDRLTPTERDGSPSSSPSSEAGQTRSMSAPRPRRRPTRSS